MATRQVDLVRQPRIEQVPWPRLRESFVPAPYSRRRAQRRFEGQEKRKDRPALILATFCAFLPAAHAQLPLVPVRNLLAHPQAQSRPARALGGKERLEDQ